MRGFDWLLLQLKLIGKTRRRALLRVCNTGIEAVLCFLEVEVNCHPIVRNKMRIANGPIRAQIKIS